MASILLQQVEPNFVAYFVKLRDIPQHSDSRMYILQMVNVIGVSITKQCYKV